jgi:hypothetical protein
VGAERDESIGGVVPERYWAKAALGTIAPEVAKVKARRAEIVLFSFLMILSPAHSWKRRWERIPTSSFLVKCDV